LNLRKTSKGFLRPNRLTFLLKVLIDHVLKLFDLRLSRLSNFEKKELTEGYGAEFDLEFLRQSDPVNLERVLSNLPLSVSQIRQDLFVLQTLNFKLNGFFVEIGASDGHKYSNTFLLEKKFGWNGILAEPGKIWHKSLKKNRIGSKIDFRCVWSTSNDILRFNETANPALSSLSNLEQDDIFEEERKHYKSYNVETISLDDLLLKHEAPKYIDYLSIDTEGSELDILRNFNFDNYFISIITVEHNFLKKKSQAICDLLKSKGFEIMFEKISKFDHWFINKKNISLSKAEILNS
jgi:FkbM family methyltransferase